jgi:hypothetical protein
MIFLLFVHAGAGNGATGTMRRARDYQPTCTLDAPQRDSFDASQFASEW